MNRKAILLAACAAAAIGAICWTTIAAPAPPLIPRAVILWEYRSVDETELPIIDSETQKAHKRNAEQVNKIAEEGWELVSIHKPAAMPTVYYFKRPKAAP
jgi:hypothetical protein